MAAAELVQRRFFRLCAAIAANHPELRDRHIELVAALVDQQQVLGLAVVEIERDQPLVAPDAVLLVHHRIADLQLREVAQHAFDGAALFRHAGAAPHDAGIELGLGDHRPAFRGDDEAVRERRHAEHEGGRVCLELLEARCRCRLQAVFREVRRHRFAPAGRFRGDEHAQLRLRQERFQPGERILRAPIDRQWRQRDRGERALAGLVRLLEVDARMILDADVELLGGNEHLGRRKQRPVGIAALHAVARVDVAPELVDGGRYVVMQGNGATLGQVVEQRRRVLEEERQVVLDAGGGHTVGDVPVQALLRRIALEELAPAAAEAHASRLVQRELARRQHADLVHRIDGALRVDVERLDRVDHLVVEVDAVGQCAAHGEEIDQPAAHAEFAGRDDLRHVLVARRGELLLQLLDVELGRGAQEKRVRGNVGRRAHAHQRGRGRHDGDVELAALDAIERGEAFRDQVVVRRELVVRQRLPVGQQAHAKLRGEPGDLVDQALRIERRRADHRERMFLLR